MSKHTPGPWRIGGLVRQIMEDRKGRGAKTEGFDRVVAVMPPWHEDNSTELEANAHLIAAAPELLEALAALTKMCGAVQVFEQGDASVRGVKWAGDFMATLEKAQAAIAKAEGSHE